jgi:hypothetical protein
MTQRRNKPRHAMCVAGCHLFDQLHSSFSYGVATGGEALVSSVTSAMEGVFVRIFFLVLIYLHPTLGIVKTHRGC